MSICRLVGVSLMLGVGLGCQASKAVSKQPVPLAVQLTSQTGNVVGMVHLEQGKPPALWPLRTIDHVEVTRAFPFSDSRSGESHDHPHHRSMWAAHGDVNGVDFWHGEGHMQHDSVDVQDGQCVIYGLWLDGQGKALLRSIVSYRVVDERDVRHVEMELVLSPVDQPVVLGDTKEGTLAVRLAPQLRVDGAVATGTLANSQGDSGRAVWGKAGTWVKVTGDIDGELVAITFAWALSVTTEGALHEAGGNSKSVRWHARTYGLIAANPFGERAFVGVGTSKETRLERGQRLAMTLLMTLETGPGAS